MVLKSQTWSVRQQAIASFDKDKYSIVTGYKGPFMGFSGLVFGLSKLRQIEAVCLFAGTQPNKKTLNIPTKHLNELWLNLKEILGF